MQKTLDRTFAYRGFHGCDSKCRLRVYEETGKPTLVLLTELEDNPGTSITNAIEHLAREVWQLLERPEGGIGIIEHYPNRALIGGRPLFKEEFDRVFFDQTEPPFTNPRWKPLTKPEVETLLGQPVDP